MSDSGASAHSPSAPFAITVLPSGRTFSSDAGETLLSAGIRQGVGLPYGCKDGACGSCKCRLLSGSVHHGNYQSKALSDDERAAGMVLTCSVHALSDLTLESRQVSELGAAPVKKMPVRVRSLNRVRPDVMLLQLQLPANDNFSYRAGQYVDFLLQGGVRRSYSMASAPVAGAAMELHIRHMPGGKFTDHVFGALKEKDILRIEGPFGSFFLREDSEQPLILLASGTGLAPVKALIEQLVHSGSTRRAYLYWGGRRPADLYLDAWAADMARQHAWLHYIPVVSDALDADAWQGRTGLVHRAVLQDHADLSQFQVYACGAPVMVDAARADFAAQAGLPEDAFFADAFTSEADKVAA